MIGYSSGQFIFFLKILGFSSLISLFILLGIGFTNPYANVNIAWFMSGWFFGNLFLLSLCLCFIILKKNPRYFHQGEKQT